MHDPYIDRANTKGVNPLVYWLVRAVLQPFFHGYFRVSRIGREHIPAEGGFIIAANHRSFLDPFIIGIMVRRPIYFVAKRELFTKPLTAWFLNNLGAFPINRGSSDEDAMGTARAILERGDGVLIFPEGTRNRPGGIGAPKRGVGRLALETGVPVVPLSIIGTENVRTGWKVRPHKIAVRAGRPLTFPKVAAPSQQLATAVTDRIWPCVTLQWEWLGGTPPIRRASILGAAAPGFAASLAAAGLEVGDDLAAADLVVLSGPSRALPGLLAEHGTRIPARAGVLVLARGLVADGDRVVLPATYVADRVAVRAVACLGGPGASPSVRAPGPPVAFTPGASLVVACADAGWRRELAALLARTGASVEQTSDVTGVELASAATGAAILAAATAAVAGPDAAGVAAGKILAEVGAYAQRHGGKAETFAGLAGAGDVVAGVVAVRPASAESLAALPLLAAALTAEGGRAPVTSGLAAVVDGSDSADAWAHGLSGSRADKPRRVA